MNPLMGIRIRNLFDPGSGIRDKHPGFATLFMMSDMNRELTIFWVKILKFLDADPDPGSGIFQTLDPG